MAAVADLLADGVEVVITHGNGPQVGNLLVKNELAAAVVPPVPLDWCGAQTQATLGFVLMDALDAGARRAAASTGVGRDRGHPHARRPPTTRASRKPTKPIGRFLPAEEAALLVEHGETWEDRGEKGWRRVVASPEPLEILDAPAVQALVDGGLRGRRQRRRRHPGRPRRRRHACAASRPSSTRTSAPPCSARAVGADVLVIATDVAHAVLRFGTPEAEADRPRARSSQMRAYAAEGHFAQRLDGTEGRRRLPVRRATGGSRAVITNLDQHRRRGRRAAPAPSSYPTDRRNLKGTATCPTPSRSARSRSTHVADASELAEADRRRRDGRRPGDRGHRQDRGQRRRQRLHPDHRRPGLPRGAGREGRRRPTQVKQVPIVWSGGTDGVISPHATIFATVPPRHGRADRRAAADRRLRDERAAAARGHRPGRR